MKTILALIFLTLPAVAGFEFDLAGVAKGRKGGWDGKVLTLSDKPGLGIKARPQRPEEKTCSAMELILTGTGPEAAAAAQVEIKWWAVRALAKPYHEGFAKWLPAHVAAGGTFTGGDVRIALSTRPATSGGGLRVFFDHKPPSVLLTAKPGSYGKKETYYFKSDWGSFDKDYIQHMALAIEVRNNAAEKLRLKVQWLAMAEDLQTRAPLVAASGSTEIEVEPSHTRQILTERLEAEGRKANYIYLGEKIREGARLTTWAVQVIWNGRVLAAFSPKADLRAHLMQAPLDIQPEDKEDH